MVCAAWALGESGVDLVDAVVEWEAFVDAGRDVVLHDALCPMTPPSFIAACLEQARASGSVVVGVRPVTDTVKVLDDDRVGETLDRESLVAVTSPLVVPAHVVAELAACPSSDLAQAVADLAAAGHVVQTVPAPAEGRRVASIEDVRLLDALTTLEG
ncbi:2-C-methyl-D-erythritol 4-phosphate cytidylyltransferase [Nocardioides alpinus]|uniref:2-C-methyl-D-erythritol 4-phosphate cytidylyltransferase n=1 Tax=Nocardioides alpinus TaxID=748909 RepID=A0A1I0YSL9_9ACTN|nr:2-C-methyl-D-erythritol 4-phosphate cytidylyltransferase [Nocardioides alpinus]SFB16389.1 2-C-methyl-D-erythritol 4-phosphate cytidylyltransferase [Nocardioides alpinus]